MALGLEALAAVAFLHQVFSRCESSRPKETMAESFGYYCSSGCMMVTLALMDLSQQLQPLVRLDTALEDAGGATMDELFVDDGVCARSALDLLGLYFILGKDTIVRPAMRYYLQISAFAPIMEIEAHIIPPVRETRHSFATGFSTTGTKHDN